ncbi:MAG: asparagine synthase (glutamine-hydrolyzing) [bacterium]|nr:asparagine synthase (glutamine-hydrolyzing) [bacterium]
MCGIAGFCNLHGNYTEHEGYFNTLLYDMAQSIKHRGPDDQGIYLNEHIGLAHRRLSIIDLLSGGQPMIKYHNEAKYVIVYNGECYNMEELRNDLIHKGYTFTTTSDTEILLVGYIAYGPDFVTRVNGIFAYAIWDEQKEELYLFRDGCGVKPLFYAIVDDTIVFGSELKALFSSKLVTAKLNKDGLNQIFSIGPAKTYGHGVFEGINEILPGQYLKYAQNGKEEHMFFSLVSKPHTDSYKDTIEKTRYLVRDAIRRQMVSDVPICTFLSGGIDSSIVTAVCAHKLKEEGKQLTTFSFDFINNDKYFKSNSFQPSRDRPYVDLCVNHMGTKHYYLECKNSILANYLYDAVDARDLPCMVDVESSLLYFCREVSKSYKVTLTGECADEIFGGYPWFHDPKVFKTHHFPWSSDMEARKIVLNDEFIDCLGMDEYALATYEKSVNETPRLDGESKEEARRREISYLNIKWFMQTLLDRMDRTSSFSGLEARVPLADTKLLEYVWNVPWEMKCNHGLVKSLLREAGRDFVPEEVLFRKKSPYPKTYDPTFEQQISKRLLDEIALPDAPINDFIDKNKLYKFIESPKDYGKPWYGQLMAGPQMIAYLLQINYWLKKYKIEVHL